MAGIFAQKVHKRPNSYFVLLIQRLISMICFFSFLFLFTRFAGSAPAPVAAVAAADAAGSFDDMIALVCNVYEMHRSELQMINVCFSTVDSTVKLQSYKSVTNN